MLKRIAVFFIVLLLTGCISPDREVLKRSRPNVTAFLSSFSQGIPMSENVFAETVTVTRVGERFNDVKRYSPSAYASHWSTEFFDWRPEGFSATTLSEIEVATPPGQSSSWYAQFVVELSYSKSNTGEHRNETWTFTSDYFGGIASIIIE